MNGDMNINEWIIKRIKEGLMNGLRKGLMNR